MNKYFRIEEGDVGTEAYHDSYVKRLETDLNIVSQDRNDLARALFSIREITKTPGVVEAIATIACNAVSHLNESHFFLPMQDSHALDDNQGGE